LVEQIVPAAGMILEVPAAGSPFLGTGGPDRLCRPA
jgi:hypothetical protein